MMKDLQTFRLAFNGEDGSWSHDEIIIADQYQHVFAWLQGYLKASNYALRKIEVMEADE